MSGLVSFVSLGPGDPSLRAARAEQRLAAADVVLRDEDAAPVERLVELARSGKRVVRAVDGDALSSADALREVLAVAEAGVPFEIVPGVGARAAAATFAGVVGRAMRVRADGVARALEGEPGEAVVTLIAAAGEPTQRVVVTTAGEAVAQARAMGVPWLVLVLAAPSEGLRWFERRPLFGKRVLVTRAEAQAASAAALLRDAGAEPVVVPTVVLGPPADPAPLARAVADLRAGAYAWAAFTSANGVDRTWEAVVAAGGDARAFGAARLAAIGPATAAALERHGLRPDVVAREFKGEGLAEDMLAAMGKPPGRVLLARAAKARAFLPDALRAAGWTVDVVAAYETRPPPAEAVEALVRQLEAGTIDVVTFTSSSTVDNLCDLLGSRAVGLLARPKVASIGPITTETARGRGLRVDVTAAQYTVIGLIQALAASYP
jgi:uroporphyrinogen III methyltransferase/synthase